MKTLIATATLTIMFLSAGAFAGNDIKMASGAKPQVSNCLLYTSDAADE